MKVNCLCVELIGQKRESARQKKDEGVEEGGGGSGFIPSLTTKSARQMAFFFEITDRQRTSH